MSIQIIEKKNGKSSLVKTVGSSSDAETIAKLIQNGKHEIIRLTRQPLLNFEIEKEKDFIDAFFSGIEDLHLLGPELIIGKLFDEIGFNAIEDEFFRYLVITRLVYPVSKLKTTDYLSKYNGVTVSIDSLYRYLDKAHKYQVSQIQDIGFRHAMRITGGEIKVVFYDVTTLYFEAEDEDDLRRMGFSKDGKNQQPQIVLGLLVNETGYPLAYELFEGNKFEGHTLIPVIEAFKTRYGFKKLVVVADSGLMSSKNLEALITHNYEFIIGARIKGEPEAGKREILGLKLQDGDSVILARGKGQRLAISYSQARARKDAHNRKRGLDKLKKSLLSGKLTKKHINNKGYNKYLTMDGDVNITIDYEKFVDDSKWDGLKGYLTNTRLKKDEIIAQYNKLYNIEKTFRISKTDLRIRPVYHYVKRRIETHICICFAACVIYKELERQLKLKKSPLSPEKIIDIAKTIFRITLITPYSKTRHSRLVVNKEEQKEALRLFDIQYG